MIFLYLFAYDKESQKFKNIYFGIMTKQYIHIFIKTLRQRKENLIISLVSVSFAVLPLIFYVYAYIETANLDAKIYWANPDIIMKDVWMPENIL